VNETIPENHAAADNTQKPADRQCIIVGPMFVFQRTAEADEREEAFIVTPSFFGPPFSS